MLVIRIYNLVVLSQVFLTWSVSYEANTQYPSSSLKYLLNETGDFIPYSDGFIILFET